MPPAASMEDKVWSKVIKSEVQDICESLKKNCYETAVVILEERSGNTSIFGSPVGAAFLSHNPLVANMFHDFFEMYRNENYSCRTPEITSSKFSVSNAVNILQRVDDQLEEDCSMAVISEDDNEENLKEGVSEQETYYSQTEHQNEDSPVESKTITRKGSITKNKVSDKVKGKKNKGKILKVQKEENCKDELHHQSQIVSKTNQKRRVEESTDKSETIAEVKPAIFRCDKCDKRFKSKAGLTAHELYIHLKAKDGSMFTMPEHRDRNLKLSYIDKEGNTVSGLRCSMYQKQTDNGDTTNYCCNICSYSTEKYNGMIEHTQIHVIRDILTCSLCDKKFKAKKSLWKHTNQHRKFPHMCKTCLKMYETKQELEEHEISHNPSHVCDICSRKYDSIGRLNYHKKISHGPKQNTCEFCGSSFRSQSLLRQHKKRHGPKQFFCDKCNCSYYFMHQLTTHLKTHDENSLKYKCTVCPREYVNKSHWKEHVKLHDGSNFVQCDQCGKSYNSRKSLNLHKSSTHVDERKFVCQVCGKAFRTKHHLKNHLITHDDKRNFKCRFCDATFKKNDVLKMHENVHTKEQKFICDICGENFLRRSSLRNHRLTHVPGHQRWKCRYCDNRFRTQSAMMTHIKNKHAEIDLSHERPLCKRCDQCGKVFAKGLTFRIHSDMHAGVKRHTCRICGNAFTDPANLRVHMKIHDGSAKRYVCDFCDTRFSSVKQYTNHMERHEMYEDNEAQQCERDTGQDLTLILPKSEKEVNDKHSPSIGVIVSKEASRAFDTAAMHATRDEKTNLMSLNTSHALVHVSTGHGLMNSNQLLSSSIMPLNNCTDIMTPATNMVNSRNKNLNAGPDDGHLRLNINKDNHASSIVSSDQGIDVKNYDDMQPQYSVMVRDYCSQYQ